MKLHIINVITILLISLIFSCSQKTQEINIPQVVTKDIQKGIEKHIYSHYKKGKGFFNFKSGTKQYSFKLVRIHTEYLANLGPRAHFACVDLVDKKGDVYDVDFFLSGDPGKMKVTKTILHKLNGKPYYFWKQNSDKTWSRVKIKDASKSLMGIITGKDTFEFSYQAKLPVIKTKGKVWLPLAKSDKFQKITIKKISTPVKYKIINEKKFNNKILYLEVSPQDSNKIISIVYKVIRKEKSAYSSGKEDMKKYLKADKLIPLNKNFKTIALKVTKNKKGNLVKARALYDHIMKEMKYIKTGKDYGKGNATYACDIGTGNCTDYHSYFIALARSVGIPARFAIGASIPSSRNIGGISGYHCWAEFQADGKWWPVDISEADKYSSLSTYYFGHHPANRIEFTLGRDLIVKPGPKAGPINFMVYPILEVEGFSIVFKPKFSFKRI